MFLSLDASLNMPLYEQITEKIKQLILSGTLSAGEAIPSIRGLAKETGASIITIKRAYDDLEALGYIKAIAAKGYFVTSNNIDNLRDMAMSKLESELDKVIIKSKSLNLSKDEFMQMLDIIYDL